MRIKYESELSNFQSPTLYIQKLSISKELSMTTYNKIMIKMPNNGKESNDKLGQNIKKETHVL